MKRYVYFISGALHYSNRLVIFKEYQITLKSPILDFSDIRSLRNELLRESKRCGDDPDGKLLTVSVINFQLLREEEVKE